MRNEPGLHVEIRDLVARVIAERDSEMEKGPTVRQAVKRYAEDHLKTLRTGDRFETMLRRHLVDNYGTRSVRSITKGEIRKLLEPFRGQGQNSNHNLHRATFLGFFSWCVSEDLIAVNPAAGIKPMKRPTRDVTLTDDQLKAVWAASMKVPHGDAIQLLILTAQRRNEIGGLQWDWIDLNKGEVTVPASAYKTKRAHSYPLGPIALEIIKACRKYDCDGELKRSTYVLGRGRAAIGYFWLIKEQIDDATGDIGDWHLHDLRRTARTRWGDFGMSADIGERLLGHSMPTIQAIYDRGKHTARKRSAMAAWETYLVAKAIIPTDAKTQRAAEAKLRRIMKANLVS